jgi:hypothetical protein
MEVEMRTVTVVSFVVLALMLVYSQIAGAASLMGGDYPYAPWPSVTLPSRSGDDYIRARTAPTPTPTPVIWESALGEPVLYVPLHRPSDTRQAVVYDVFSYFNDGDQDVIYNLVSGSTRARAASVRYEAGEVYLPRGASLIFADIGFYTVDGTSLCEDRWASYVYASVGGGPWLYNDPMNISGMEYGEFNPLSVPLYGTDKVEFGSCKRGWAFWFYPGRYDPSLDTLRVRFGEYSTVVIPPTGAE